MSFGGRAVGPFEHMQNRRASAVAKATSGPKVQISDETQDALKTLDMAKDYQVVHMWKKAEFRQNRRSYFAFHHTHIFICLHGKALMDFGAGVPIFYGTAAGVGPDNTPGRRSWDNEVDKNPYRISESYHPNPVIVPGKNIQKHFYATVGMCAANYDLLTNNCHSFARIFMLKCGAKHYRHAFHP
jgi:hypothetical protein